MTTKENSFLYEKAVHQYCEEFCEIMWDDKDVYDEYFWVSEDVGGIICLCDYWFNFATIKQVVDEGIDKDIVFEWYYYNLNGGKINLHNYSKGVRDEISEEKVKYNHDEIINASNSVEFDARVEEIMAKLYEQDCWIVPEYEQIRMLIYTKLAPKK